MNCCTVQGNTINIVEANYLKIEIQAQGFDGETDLSGYSSSFSYVIADRTGLKIPKIQGNTLIVEIDAYESLGIGNRTGNYEARIYKDNEVFTVILGKIHVIKAVDPRLTPPTAEEVFAQSLTSSEVKAETLEAGQDATVSVEFGNEGQAIVTFGIPKGEDTPQIDDTSISKNNPWSSQNIIDRLCPPLNASGNPVIFYPVEMYPLEVTTQVKALIHLDWVHRLGFTTQENTPTPENPSPLTDYLKAGTYCTPTSYQPKSYWQIILDSDLSGVTGCQDAVEIDAYTGKSRIVKNINRIVLNGTETIVQDPNGHFVISGNPLAKDNGRTGICSHFSYSFSSVYVGTNGAIYFNSSLFESVEEVKNYLISQNDTGNPVVICYGLAKPIITNGQCIKVDVSEQDLGAVSMRMLYPDINHPCVITGWNNLNIVHSNSIIKNEYSIDFPEELYGANIKWETGILTVTHGYIESFNGEPLPGEWISSENRYKPGTTPSIGSQVVYALSDPYTIQFDIHQVYGLAGKNTIQSNTGETSVNGKADLIYFIENYYLQQ